MAFQPIVDADQRAVFAYEALVRGLEGEGALEVLGRVGPEQRFAFHEACRMRAIELAARLGMRAKLSLNVMPNDVAGQEQCFRSAMAAAARFGFPVEQLMFELTEGERVRTCPAWRRRSRPSSATASPRRSTTSALPMPASSCWRASSPTS